MGRHAALPQRHPDRVSQVPRPRQWPMQVLFGVFGITLALTGGFAIDYTVNNRAVDNGYVTAASALAVAPDQIDKYNCSDFNGNRESAQKLYDSDTSDPNRLDQDNDGIACENTSGRPEDAVVETYTDIPGGQGDQGIPEFEPGTLSGPGKDVSSPVTTSTPTSLVEAPPAEMILPTTTSATKKSTQTKTPSSANTPADPPDVQAEMADPAPPKAVVNAKCTNIQQGIGNNVYLACNKILAAVPGVTFVGGYGTRPGNPTSCHPKGQALDIMVYNNKALGDRIFAYVTKNSKALQATTILWQVPNHYDHVHVSFLPCKF